MSPRECGLERPIIHRDVDLRRRCVGVAEALTRDVEVAGLLVRARAGEVPEGVEAKVLAAGELAEFPVAVLPGGCGPER